VSGRRDEFKDGSVAAQGRSLLLQIVGDHLHEARHGRSTDVTAARKTD
jgi:hypothetical protein